jgi:hypothetical protein
MWMMETIMNTRANPPNWTIDEPCGTLRLGRRLSELRLRAHLADEDFVSHTPTREFVPLTVARGRRTVVTAHLCTADPDLMPVGLRQPRIGGGDAYFYHADAVLLLWKCNLLPHYRATDPTRDDNLSTMWEGFEALLLRQFSQARQMVTPAWNRPYDETRWQAFLGLHGFTRRSPSGITGAALIKDLPANV